MHHSRGLRGVAALSYQPMVADWPLRLPSLLAAASLGGSVVTRAAAVVTAWTGRRHGGVCRAASAVLGAARPGRSAPVREPSGRSEATVAGPLRWRRLLAALGQRSRPVQPSVRPPAGRAGRCPPVGEPERRPVAAHCGGRAVPCGARSRRCIGSTQRTSCADSWSCLACGSCIL